MRSLLAAILLSATSASAVTRAGYGAPLNGANQAEIPASITTTGDAVIGGQITVVGTGTVQGNAFSVGASTFYITGSSIGIRTTAPAYALHVGGDEYASGQGIVAGTMTVIGSNFSVGATTLTVAGGYITLRGTATFGGGASSTTFLGPMLFSQQVQVSSGIYFATTGSSITGVGLSISTPSATTPGFSLDANNRAFFTLTGGTKAYPCSNIGFYPYTTSASTTTAADATNEIAFSTLTVPANLVSQAGDRLVFKCFFHLAANANVKTPHIRFNNGSGTFTDIGATGTNSGNNVTAMQNATLTWLSTALWINDAVETSNSSVVSGVPANSGAPPGTQTFAETSAMDFNCTCKNGTASAGDCSFLYATIDFCPAGK